jgi:hypothetical protein
MDGPHLLRAVAELGCLVSEPGRSGTGGCRLGTDLLSLVPALPEGFLRVLGDPGWEEVEV